MQENRDVSGSPQLGDTVEQDPFSDASINAQIAADVLRIGSAWLEWNAEPVEGTFDDKITETLVNTLDAHANALLRAVKRDAQLPEYMKHLRRVGSALIENAQTNSVLKNPYPAPPPLSPESLREEMDRASASLRQQRSGMLPRDSNLNAAHASDKVQSRADVANATAEMAPPEEARRWHEWRNQIVNRIEMRFEARYRHWHAEALERLSQKKNIVGQKGRVRVDVREWEQVEIEFLSDERVQIRIQDKTETRNYAEMGFVDKRNEKPNQSWVVLRTLAQNGGTFEDSADARKKWSAVEKHIQRIREALREHFALGGDPIPFVPGVGYRARFKIRCAASFET
jgi:hypothetical protein